ncbi:MAG: 30S ribosomal protein S2 [Candidatus Nanoarchaeia archaeon]
MPKKKIISENEKSAPKENMASLVEELKQRISSRNEDSENKIESLEQETKTKSKKSETDLSDKEIEELSHKISKKEVEEVVSELKRQKENVDGKKETLIPLEEYVKCAVHLGTKVITPHMRKFVYKRRADGLAVINTTFIDDKLRDSIEFIKNYSPQEIILICKREAGWPPVEKFSEITGVRCFTKKYPAGVTTNLDLENFFENELTIICDPWIDKNALNDSQRLKKPVVALCDTNNFTKEITKIIPCNNKAKKSIGCILFILAREYCKAKKIEFKAKLEDFTGPLEDAPK